MNKTAVTFLVLLLLAGPASGLNRVNLGVVCELVEKRYRQTLEDPQIREIEQSCAVRLAQELNATLAFLKFAPDNNHENKLVIRLGKDDSAIRSVDFSVQVKGDAVEGSADPVYWPFRTVDQWLEIPRAAEFPDHIHLQFTKALRKNQDALVSEQLSRIRIADNAVPVLPDRSWQLPFTRDELQTQDDSEFGIKAQLEMPDQSRERYIYEVKLKGDFTDGAKAMHLRDDTFSSLEESLRRLGMASQVEVIYVVVKHYVPLELPSTTPPSGLVLSGQEEAP